MNNKPVCMKCIKEGIKDKTIDLSYYGVDNQYVF